MKVKLDWKTVNELNDAIELEVNDIFKELDKKGFIEINKISDGAIVIDTKIKDFVISPDEIEVDFSDKEEFISKISKEYKKSISEIIDKEIGFVAENIKTKDLLSLNKPVRLYFEDVLLRQDLSLVIKLGVTYLNKNSSKEEIQQYE